MNNEQHNSEQHSNGQHANGQHARGRRFRPPRQAEPARRPDRISRQINRDDEGSRQAHKLVQRPPEPPAFSCALCEKPIFDLAGALSDRETGAPVHFDCALERVAAAEHLAPGEKIIYIGQGAFAVVEDAGGRPEGAFVVKRRIPWEKEGEKKEWRKALSSGILQI